MKNKKAATNRNNNNNNNNNNNSNNKKKNHKKKKSSNSNSTRLNHEKNSDYDNNNQQMMSDEEDNETFDEDDVEFVKKNAMFTKRFLANSKDLTISEDDDDDDDTIKTKKRKYSTVEMMKKKENDDDEDDVERLFIEQEKAKKQKEWEVRRQSKEANEDDYEDDDENVKLLLPVKRLDGTLVKRPILKEVGQRKKFEAFQNINADNDDDDKNNTNDDDDDDNSDKDNNDNSGGKIARIRKNKSLNDEDLGLEKKRKENAGDILKKKNWWDEDKRNVKVKGSSDGSKSNSDDSNINDDDGDIDDEERRKDVATASSASIDNVDYTFSAKKYVENSLERRYACRQFIAELCQKTIEQPETHIKDAAKLIKTLCDDPYSKDVAQDACASMTLLLIDILPDYKLREINAEKNELSGLSEKIKKQRKEEDLLSKIYKSFLRLLTKNAKKGVHSVVSGPSPSVSGKCLIQFLLKKPNSNYRGEILRAIISSSFTSSDVTIAEEASNAFSEICRADENGDHTLEILQLIAELVKKNMKSIWPQSIAWFKNINLNAAVSALKPDDERFQKSTRKQQRKERASERELSRKQRAKMSKALHEKNRMKPFIGDGGANNDDDNDSDSDNKSFKRRLEKSIKKDLAEAEGGKIKSWKEKIKIQSKMIEAVFEVYVRVLKRATDEIEDGTSNKNNTYSSDDSDSDFNDHNTAAILLSRRKQNRKRGTFALIAPTLENLPNISRLIDVDYMADLSSLFTKALSSKRFSIADKCRVVLCLVDSFAGGGIESALADVDLSSTRNKVFSEILCSDKYKVQNDSLEFIKSLSLPHPPDADNDDFQNSFDFTYDELEVKAKGSLRVDAIAAFLNSQTLGETITASTQRVASQAFGAMNTSTAMAFIKKITNVSIETVESGEAIGLLIAVADCLRRAPKTRDVLDFTKERKFAPSASGGGLHSSYIGSKIRDASSKKNKKKSSSSIHNRFNSDAVNPEKANGGVATAWELFLLREHFNPAVASAATAVLNHKFDEVFQSAHKMSRRDETLSVKKQAMNLENDGGVGKNDFFKSAFHSKARTTAGSCARVGSTLSGSFHPEVSRNKAKSNTNVASAAHKKSKINKCLSYEELEQRLNQYVHSF
jgi:hypothetical protein